jgi:hypothetical protein
VYDRLDEEGVMAINVGRAPDDRRLIDGLVGTMSTVFPSLYVMDLPGTFNTIVYATRQPTKIENLYENYLYLLTLEDVHPLLIHVIEQMVVYQQPLPESQTVYTDDLAPIEWVTNDMVLKYVFFGEIEELK